MDAVILTTDEIAEQIRERVRAVPGPAIACAPGVHDLTTLLRDRLPYVATDDLGAALLYVSCYLADAAQILRGPQGLSAHDALLVLNDVVALAGERLYTEGQRAAHDRRNGGDER